MAMRYDIEMDQGSRWVAQFKPEVDWLTSLTGYSARGKVKTSRTLPGATLLFDFASYMSVNASTGIVTVDVPANILAGQTWTAGEYDFELFDADPAHDVRFVEGYIRICKEVTT